MLNRPVSSRDRFARVFAGILVASIIVPFAARATEPSDYGGLRWRMIGPALGGRVPAVAGAPSQPDVFYLGSAGGGVWKTTDDGLTWKPIFDHEPVSSIGAIGIAPSNPNVIYVGTGEYDMRSSIIAGNGVYKSTNAGKTWQHLGLTDTQQIGRIVVDPRNPNIAFVAALGHPYAANAQRGVFRTTNGGRTWQKVLYKNADTGAIDLAMDPRDSKIVYASLWQTRRPPWHVYPPSAGPGSGLYKSTNGGNTWQQLTNGIPSAGLGKIGLAIAPSNPNRVYALLNAKKGGLYRSDDAGMHWKRVNATSDIWDRAWYFCTIAVDPHNPSIVFIGDVSMYRSVNGGKKFTPFGGNGGADFHTIWIDPTNSRRMIVGADQGAFATLNGGKSWSSNSGEPISEFYRIATDDRSPYWVYAAQQDNGSVGLPTRTNHGAITLHDMLTFDGGGESGYIAPDPNDPNKFFGTEARQPGTLNFEDVELAQVADYSPNTKYPGRYGRSWTLPVVFSKRHPAILYYSEQRLFRSPDEGRSWTAISPDLTRQNDPIPANLDPVTASDLYGNQRRGIIFTIAPSPIVDGTLWIGTDDGKIWTTSDEGDHWRDVTPPQLTPWSKVTLIEASSHDANTAYAAIDRHRLDDTHPYIYRTHDGGRTWSLVVSGIPPGSFVNGIREDPVRAGLLYAATEKAVYVSLDDGASWQSLQLNMPVVSVRDLVVHGDDLVAGTHGRSWWVLDDLAPLRQLSAAIENAPGWLFEPLPAQRFSWQYNPSTFSQQPGEFDGENPPNGAIIDYFVGAHTRGPVNLDVLDGSGRLVRHFTSVRKKHGKRPQPRLMQSSAPIEARLWTHPGMHRFVWDLSYASSSAYGRGVLAPPGLYQIRLSVGGRTYKQMFTLQKDARVTASDADLVAQYDEARTVQTMIDRITWINQQAAAIKKHLTKVQKSGSTEDRASAKALLTQLNVILGAAPQAAPDDSEGPPETNTSTLHYLNGQLSGLENSIEGYDAAPPRYMIDAGQRYRTQLQGLEGRFDTVKQQSQALAPHVRP